MTTSKNRRRTRLPTSSRCPPSGCLSGGAFFFCFSDRKSTRLNSSHLGISYAVFFLKKKKQKTASRAFELARAVYVNQVSIASSTALVNPDRHDGADCEPLMSHAFAQL